MAWSQTNLKCTKCDPDCSLLLLSKDDCQLVGSVSSTSMRLIFHPKNLLTVQGAVQTLWVKRKCCFISQYLYLLFIELLFLFRLERHLERKAWVASFGRPKMTPQSLLASPTGLSPYLRFGCLSTRLFYHALSDLYRKVGIASFLILCFQALFPFRLKSVIPLYLYTASYSGENSSIAQPQEIQTLIKWVEIQFVSR